MSGGSTGHAEAVEVLYDPAKISYAQLLEVFWRNIDPLAHDRQFCDKESQYLSAIFYRNAEQERLAQKSKDRLERSGRFTDPIVTQITRASAFYAAEDYHQDYSPEEPTSAQAPSVRVRPRQETRTGVGRNRLRRRHRPTAVASGPADGDSAYDPIRITDEENRVEPS